MEPWHFPSGHARWRLGSLNPARSGPQATPLVGSRFPNRWDSLLGHLENAIRDSREKKAKREVGVAPRRWLGLGWDVNSLVSVSSTRAWGNRFSGPPLEPRGGAVDILPSRIQEVNVSPWVSTATIQRRQPAWGASKKSAMPHGLWMSNEAVVSLLVFQRRPALLPPSTKLTPSSGLTASPGRQGLGAAPPSSGLRPVILRVCHRHQHTEYSMFVLVVVDRQSRSWASLSRHCPSRQTRFGLVVLGIIPTGRKTSLPPLYPYTMSSFPS